MNKNIEKYINLDIDTKEFINLIFNDEILYKELTNFLPTEKTINDNKWKGFAYSLSLKTHSYDLRKIIKFRFSNGTNPSGKSAMYEFFYKVLETNGFKFEYKTFYKERFNLLMGILPDYIGGEETEIYIDSFVNSLDANLPENQKRKKIKEMIKQNFIYDKKKPVWLQEPEWPIADKPMKFISQKQIGDCCKYLFEDISTGNKKEITQYA